MQSFLEEVVSEICQKQDKLDDVIFVLPSKRAGAFLRNAIAKTLKKTQFSPEIYSIETFVEKVSCLKPASNTQQLFELYKVYLDIVSTEKNDFYTFSKWAITLLQDFNEIDRYLVDAKKIFSNLTDIQEISHWSPEFEKTKMMEDYLAFWNKLEPLYEAFNLSLLDQGLGHQGLIYRKAYENLENYKVTSLNKKHIFIGFNALNKAETLIIQGLLTNSKNEIYWDIDKYFLEDPVHDAGFFLRKHLNDWPQFEVNNPKGISNHYLAKKNIEVIGLPKNVSQANLVGDILKELNVQNSDTLKKTAVVLGDETLLNPVLNAIPLEISTVNITMGYPLGKTSLADLFMRFMNLYINKETLGWYHRTILEFLSHPSIQLLLTEQGDNNAQNISKSIIKQNLSFIQSKQIIKIAPAHEKILTVLFSEEIPTPINLITKCITLIEILRIKLREKEDYLELEHLYRFHQLFNQINDLVLKHPYINDLRSLQSLYQQLLTHETLDFRGEPLEGLQLMGMLESRNLDFDSVILTSVNEGILPAGKSNNSFIPIDLKQSFGLPTFKEKDAVYTYHFYRLLQRAKNIYLLYNTEPDVLEGGEKSRLIMQLLTDKNRINDISETVLGPKITPYKKELESISKDPDLMELIKGHSLSGFSPTSLSNYIRNPLDFYKRNLLRIDDLLEVEENVAANTFGTIVHDVLEKIYSPFVGKFLEETQLKNLKPQIRDLVKTEFENSYPGGLISRGKNLIAYNVITKYVENFIDMEIEELKAHKIKILGLEDKFRINIDIPEIDFPIILKGKLDRIDSKDGLIRIIDYKTGKVDSKNVEIVDWHEIITDYDYSKAFQLLCYVLMFNDKNTVQNIESGIISFKNLSAGLLKFATKDKRGSWAKKNSEITQEVLSNFQEQLKKLILEICNPNVPFLEKEI